ncbi:hypothetical protein [Cellulomonas sp. RIT-PI-Y]|uniref:hypothetical protein n=1 Tax=Cellulomonas sp. RIT-PI-Y TaxID=3035297 RepID=UPI0021D9C196|nr:hypothetical protein [Cellulomonas sp. RIT-PI-Y]
MSTPTANDFLLGGGGKSAKFDQVGDTVTGKIVSTEIRQQTDLQGNPLEWDNGDPRMQLVVTLATDIRDDDEDDGHRALYVKGSKAFGSKSLHDAVRSAVQESGAKGLETGGTLTVSYTGSEPAKTRGFNDRKLYQASYAAPDRAAATGDYLGTGSAAQPGQQPTLATAAAAVQQQPAPAAGGNETADKVRQLIALGLDDATISGAVGLDAGVIAAFRTAA